MVYDAHNFKHEIEREMGYLDGSRLLKGKQVKLSDYNAQKILEFKDRCFAEQLSRARVLLYMEFLRKIAMIVKKDFKDFSRKDVESVLTSLKEKDKSAWTIQGYKIGFKKFFKWLYEVEFNKKFSKRDYPEIISWIDTTMPKQSHKMPEELLTEKDIIKVINICDSARDKALISILWESGCRIGEILNIQRKHIEFNKNHYAKITVTGKTGMRKLILVLTVPYLQTWLQTLDSIGLNKPDDYIWVSIGTTNKNKVLTYIGVSSRFNKLVKKSGIAKRFNPHLFRHSRASELAKLLTEAQMNQYFGWVQGSYMASNYVHLSGRDMDKKMLEIAGIETPETRKQEVELKPKECFGCETINEATNKFCKKCGRVLDIRTAVEMEEMRKNTGKQMFNEEIIELFAKKYIQEKAPEIIQKLLQENPESLKEILKMK